MLTSIFLLLLVEKEGFNFITEFVSILITSSSQLVAACQLAVACVSNKLVHLLVVWFVISK